MDYCVHCGSVALFKTKTHSRPICQISANKCPAVKEKNSRNLKASYASGKRISGKARYENFSDESKDKMNYRKGKRYAVFEYGAKGQHKNALLLERGHQCEQCRLTEWNNIPITLELEHTDGDRKNNTRENLKLLCPNCHSQTPTWKRTTEAVWRKRKYSDEIMIAAIQDCYNLQQVLDKLDLRYGSAGTIIKVMSEYNIGFKLISSGVP